jgi:hypothetical protein
MTDHFDPRRHRVFAVDRTISFRTYVAAQTPEEAEGAARADDDVAAEFDLATVDCLTQEVPLSGREAADTPLCGPALWGRRRLSVNEALDVIARPRPEPPVLATTELRQLGGWDWLRLAAATDLGRPALRAIHVRGGRGVAADGRRLHIAPLPCADGLWDAELLEPVDGGYPPFEHFLERTGPVMELTDLERAWEVLRYARRGMVELPFGLGRATFVADQLAEALLGAGPGSRVLLAAAARDTAVRLDFPDVERTALLTRVAGRHPGADLSLFVRPLDPAAVIENVPNPIESRR